MSKSSLAGRQNKKRKVDKMCVYFENDLELISGSEQEKRVIGKAICPDCKGSGLINHEKCEYCCGVGFFEARWTWTITNRKEAF
jgi:DnaJ-class molecular chaperone